MCIYVVVSIILLFLFIQEKKHNAFVFFIISWLIFFMLLAGHNGEFINNMDYKNYMYLFLGKSSMYGSLDVDNGYELEWPFYYFMKFLRLIFPQTNYAYVMAYATFISIPIFLLTSKMKDRTPLALVLLILLFGGYSFVFLLSIQRQMLAISFFIYAYYIYQYTNLKRKNLYILILCFLGLMSHSSSYLVLPLIMFVLFVKFMTKKTMYMCLIISFIMGIMFQHILQSYFSQFISLLSAFSVLDRTTYYTMEGVYDLNSQTFTSLFPYTLLGLITIWLYKKEELNTIASKSLIISIIWYNLFSSIPLFDRSIFFFVILGLTNGLPSLAVWGKGKIIYSVIILLFLYLNIKHVYSLGNYQMLPYPFIFS